jgi:3-carboxy-cis,cis-muconate cycloisomerase
MAFAPADSQIFAPLFSDPDLAAIFSDEQFIHYMLRVESAVARVESRLGIIPRGAADAIFAASDTLHVNMDQLERGVAQDGLPIIELVRQIQAQVGKEYAPFVHWAATTQDIMDTAEVLQLRAALELCDTKLRQAIHALAFLAEKHRATVMAGRTHSQQALPITFGFQVAVWLAPLLRHRQRLQEIKARAFVVQFGGAVGTLAALGEKGIAVQDALAGELELEVPLLPWHTQRDALAEVANWLSLVTGSLAKMAQDIILLAQTEVGEVRESDDRTRGGSSTMPQKSNPIVSELIIAAARANASLLATMHHALIQEHERATHGWQLEWLTLPQMFAHTASALNHAIFLGEHLAVDAAQMAENVRASKGLMLAEPITFALAQFMPRPQAKQLVTQACQIAIAENRHLADVVREQIAVPMDWESLREESAYLGSAAIFIDRVLRAADASR